MCENIFLRIKCYLLDKQMIAFFITDRCLFLLAKHMVMFLKIHGECSFRTSRGVKFPKFPASAPNRGACSLTTFRILQNTFYI